MTLPIRSILTLSILVSVLAACSTTIGAPASPSASPTAEPTVEPTAEPTASPTAEPTVEPTAQPTVAPTAAPSVAPVATPAPVTGKRDVAGIITMAEMAFSGPGGTIQEALNHGPTGNDLPILVNGVLFRDTDGTIYLATAVSDASVPSFEAPLLEVRNFPNDGPTWDMANADVIGLQEANGIVFKPDSQVLGFLEIP